MIRVAPSLRWWLTLVLFTCTGFGKARAAEEAGGLAPDEVLEGRPLTLRAEVTGGTEPLTYQWYKDGVALAPTIGPVLRFAAIQPGDAGIYFVTVHNDFGLVISPMEIVRVRERPRSRLTNASLLLAGMERVTAGFTLGGAGTSGSTPMLVRAAGPALVQFGVGGVFPDPVLRLMSGARLVASNDNWEGSEAMLAVTSALGAFPFAPASRDAALQASLAAGAYLAEIADAEARGGTVAFEIYEGRTAERLFLPRLVGVSARAVVGGAGGSLVAGFTIEGEAPLTLLLRASGPALAVPGTAGTAGIAGGALADPRLVLFRGADVVAGNDNWSDGDAGGIRDAVTRLGSVAWKDNSADAALLVTLAPGTYSAQVASSDGTTGLALLEIQVLP